MKIITSILEIFSHHQKEFECQNDETAAVNYQKNTAATVLCIQVTNETYR